ncbi:MAG: lipoyl(octanoyl) transferase LipB [Gammaproteobacteria bacterium]|nr:lipoyl(octanoyl) transferase LipB [Gammaproteobacteria bacterium]
MTSMIQIRQLGLVDYASTLASMNKFTDRRSADTPDELWLLEHAPVFTLGLAAKRSHLLAPGEIPVVQVDRGGQVTYHGPGQLIAYTLIDLKRAGLTVRSLVSALENAVINTVAEYGIEARNRREAPGVYVGEAKLASIGLRIRRGCSYHGLALNVDMDLTPFTRINPCGFAGMQMTQLTSLGGPDDLSQVANDLGHQLQQLTG